MYKYYKDKEIKQKLKEMIIICDTREQVNQHIIDYFDEKKFLYIKRKLDIADYSFISDNMTFENEIVIEKKNSIDEIASNFTVDRQRFEDEFLRAKANNIKVFLLIENCTWEDIKLHNYRSKLLPKALMASLLSWQVKYNISIIFCKPTETAEIIYATFYYWLKQKLEGK